MHVPHCRPEFWPVTVAFFSAWAASGPAIAKAYTDDPDWWRFTPLSMLLGPLWLAVAAEQRSVPVDPSHEDR